MDGWVLIVGFFILLALNALFVLAEFAIVKVRPSRVEEMLAARVPLAATLASIQKHLDEYLSVCQVGITLASVALGMVGKEASDLFWVGTGEEWWRYALAVGISLLVVSGTHIVFGEQVPKYLAIRQADRMALFCALPLRFFHRLFFPALWVLTRLANLTLRVFGLGRPSNEEIHSEQELRILLDRSQERGMMSFRRLLLFENVFDFGGLIVRDAMRPRSSVQCLDSRLPWEENLRAVRSTRYTRFPLLSDDPDRPEGFVHLKDLILRSDACVPELRGIVRPILTVREDTPLEAVLAEMQRKHLHAALVNDLSGRWSGFLTLEDILEELVGTIRDEFEEEEAVRLSDALSPDRVHLNIQAETPLAALRQALDGMPVEALPLSKNQILAALQGREHLVGTYLGQGIGLPHARLVGLKEPFVMILRSTGGVSCEGSSEKAHLLFVLLTPAGQPRVHQRLQSVIATLLHESGYVKERLLTAETVAEVLEVVRSGEQATLD